VAGAGRVCCRPAPRRLRRPGPTTGPSHAATAWHGIAEVPVGADYDCALEEDPAGLAGCPSLPHPHARRALSPAPKAGDRASPPPSPGPRAAASISWPVGRRGGSLLRLARGEASLIMARCPSSSHQVCFDPEAFPTYTCRAANPPARLTSMRRCSVGSLAATAMSRRSPTRPAT
jgi:hypothetical protein